MGTPIQPIKVNEQSVNMTALHAVMLSLGMPVDVAEVEDQRAGQSTEKLIREFQRRLNLTPQAGYLVDAATATALAEAAAARAVSSSPVNLVYGTVTSPDGKRARGLRVVAFDQDMRKRQTLGQATTRADGTYTIQYDDTQFQEAEEGSADLVLVVYGQGDEVLQATAPLFNAPKFARVDIVLAGTGTEALYKRIVRLLTPLLDGQDVTLDSLEEDDKHQDLSFASGETGIALDMLTAFAVAKRLPKTTKLPEEFWFAVLATKTITPGSPGTAPGIDALASSVVSLIPSTPADTIESGLKAAVTRLYIEPASSKEIPAWVRGYSDLLSQQAEKNLKITTILGAAGVPDSLRSAFLAAYLQGGTRDEIVQRMKDSKQFNDQQINAVTATLAVNDLLLGDSKLLRELRKTVADPSQVSSVARMSSSDWKSAISKAGTTPPPYVAGDTAEAKLANYATLLAKRASLSFPTAAFAGDMARALGSQVKPALPSAATISRFFDAHPDFELATTSVDGYLKKKARAEFANSANNPKFVQDLKSAQRVFKLAPNYSATNQLLADGLHSAQQIYRLGETQFVQKYSNKPGFSKAMAHEVFQKAANTHAAVVAVVGQLRSTQSANQVRGLANPAADFDSFPDLANLFGNLTTCACDECQSIFGPSAYLADLLHYLEGRLLIPPTGTVRQVFTDRRPDVGYIELTCENSNTPLPYIDLACEIMEDHVAPWVLFTLPLALTPNFLEGPPNATVVNAFATAATPVTLSAAARVSAQDEFGNWVIHDTAQTYLVQPQAAGLAVSILRQTHLTADELSANPEYVNRAAYNVLSTAHFPLSLPFDLFTEEVRAYLSKMKVNRSLLMETFRGSSAPNNPQDIDIQCEYMGISKVEQGLIFNADPANQFVYWGTANNAAALAAMTKVDVFLDVTGLEFKDLQRFLSLAFVNPGGAIVIQDLDSSCDPAQKRLQVLDANALDRFHRFLRLWKKLGWKMWEVDLVIQVLGGGVLDNNLPTRLFPFLQIQNRYSRLSVEQLCAFYGNINTVPKFTEVFKKPDPSLYENLFLNKRITNPLDPAFALSAIQPPTDVIANHVPPVLAATKVKQTDLAILQQLTNPGTGLSFINNQLSLPNLSFLYRHALLAKTLSIKITDWNTLLFLLQQDVFASPQATWDFFKLLDRIRASKFTIDQLNYILMGDPSARASATEKTTAAILTTLQKSLQGIAVALDPSSIPATADGLSNAISSQVQTLGWDAVSAAALVSVFTNQIQNQRSFPTAPAGFSFGAIANTIQVGFDSKTNYIRFTGVMTDAEKLKLLTDASLAAVTALPAYQRAINDLYDTPRLLIKFYLPSFSAPLAVLPKTIQFAGLQANGLSSKIQYDPDLAQLIFLGIMSTDDQDALNNLSPDVNYRAAVQSLFNQARAAGSPASELWLTLANLTLPQPADSDAVKAQKIVKSLSVAEFGDSAAVPPVVGLAPYVTRKLSIDQVIQQVSAALGITQAIARTLLTEFAIFGPAGSQHPLLPDFLDANFVNASSAITPDAFPELYQGYYWMHRVALILKTLAITFTDLQWIVMDQAATGVIDVGKLPLTYNPAVSPTGLNALIDLADLMLLHHTMSQDDLTLLDIIDKLIHPPAGSYTNTQFAADLDTLAQWTPSDVGWLTAAGNLDLVFPAGYQNADGWRRLVQAITILQALNATAVATAALATPSLGSSDATSLKQILRSKFDEQTFLTLSKPIEDALRERKRDSLVAYLLTQPMPADNPTQKWTDPEDLFAYYLIDVQMCSCQPTSRVVQASAAVQLFVQRCFMGLEPQVRVSVDADSGWNDWSWMKYYRVWEANRRVFAFPENYAEPDLRKDKSEIFTALQNELLQNDVTPDNVETAFEHYLEGLDNVARLEVAGMYYQETTQTLHVFGNTAGDPPLYYYRQFVDGSYWTAWSKVESDIKARYVVPLIANERLYLVWPEFRSQASPPSNLPIPPAPSGGSSSNTVNPPTKDRYMHLAISEFKSKKWTPKKVSRDSVNVGSFTDDDFKPYLYSILPIDLTWLPDRLFPPGTARPAKMPNGYEWILEGPFLLQACGYRETSDQVYGLDMFELAGCKGYPEGFEGNLDLAPIIIRFDRDGFDDTHNLERYSESADALVPKIGGTVFPSSTILKNTPGLFEICYPHYLSYFDKSWFGLPSPKAPALGSANIDAVQRERIPVTLGTFYDWFYADKLRTFFIRPEFFSRRLESRLYYQDILAFLTELAVLIAEGNWAEFLKDLFEFYKADYRYQLHFFSFYHPLVCLFAKKLYQKDVEGLMARETQFADRELNFSGLYEPTALVDYDYPQEIVEFEPNASCSIYNWELFYFAPMYVAERLSQNQQFEQAMRWYHFVFDPTGSHDTDPLTGAPASAPQKYWITKPFYLRQDPGPTGYTAESLENLMTMLATDPTNPLPNPAIADLRKYVALWRKNPFDPHMVAKFRTVAYQKFAVMKYLENLIAWGDQLFRQDTLESVNSATQLYVVAAEILGERPEDVPPSAKPLPLTFNELDPKLDAFSNALVDFENLMPAMPASGGFGPPSPSVPSLLYFCIPQNNQLLGYWNTVEDRLYKIRHCLNIEGVFAPPALFAPPIDPMALVRAAAAGLDISSALSDLGAPLPFYRFTTTIQKANEFTADVKALGGALLAALEKSDVEGVALLRQGQEIALLQAVREVKQRQIDDAQLVIDGLQKSREMVTIKRDYYASREFMNAGEIAAMTLSAASLVSQLAGTIADVLAGVMFIIPDFHAGASGFGGSPHVVVQEGGQNIGQSATRGANGLYQVATMLEKTASISSTVASFQRRMDDWQNQLNLANKELEQLDKQIASANVKLDIATKELANQDLQIANSQAVNDFMKSKYTNQELYNWMIGQISQTYFQSYQVAYDLAQRAERCFRFELGISDSSFIQFGYWDSLKKGLQSGERMQLDLRRLESAYLDQNRRDFECTKHISLAMLNPMALIALRDQGIATFTLPEELFDLDYAGHYFRRLKTVAISIPCVAGPNTTVSATLRLIKNMIRVNTDAGSQYIHNQDDSGALTDDDRFRESNIRVNAIATSSAQNDSGMFDLNFREERYLPFEGAGVLSTWQLELTQDAALRQFNYDTITDVILHVRYTSREDTGPFRDAAVGHLKNDVLANISPQLPLIRLFDLIHEFPTEWYAFLHPPAGAAAETLQIKILNRHFPFLAQNRTIELQSFSLYVRTASTVTKLAGQVDPSTNGASVFPLTFGPADSNGFYTITQNGGLAIDLDETQPWVIQLGTSAGKFNTLTETDILDCYLVAEYTLP